MMDRTDDIVAGGARDLAPIQTAAEPDLRRPDAGVVPRRGDVGVHEVRGAQITTTRVYFEDKNRVRHIWTTAGGASVQDLSYAYDDRLNVVRRTNDRQGKSEYFDYDDLDRLTCARFHLVPGCSETYDYHPNGNFESSLALGRSPTIRITRTG